MNDVIAFRLNNIGELRLEQILVEFDIPELFICVDNMRNRYAVLCTDISNASIEYIIIKITSENLVHMLEKKITMRKFFLNGSDNRVWYVKSVGNIDNDEIESGELESVPENFLPRDNALFVNADPAISIYLEKIKGA